MSRFIEKLKQLSQAATQPMGFRATPADWSQRKMLLIASLAQADLAGVVDYAAGADAGLLQVSELSSVAEAIRQVSQAVPDIPWGTCLQDTNQSKVAELVETGCDFTVFSAASAALPILQNNGIGKVMQVTVSCGDGLLRTLDKLPVDAVLISNEQEQNLLTWQHLMHFQRCADLLAKPLLASIPSDVAADELQALWRAGVNGIIIEVGAEQSVDRLTELRQTIDKLTLPPQSKRSKPAALIPHLGGKSEASTEEPEEEE